MKSNTFKFALIILVCIVLSACEDSITWDVNNDQIKLVVDGRVTTELKRHKILLTKTADYFNASLPETVEGAEVLVSDGVDIFRYVESEPGIYLSENAFAGEVGKEYALSIELQTPLGESSLFVAASTILPPMNVDSLYSIKEPISENEEVEVNGVQIDSIYILGIYAQEVEEVANGYLFEVFVNEELVTETIFDVGVFSDDFIEGQYLEDFLVHRVDNAAIADSVSLLMYSLEQEYITFIDALIVESEGGDPFGLSGPPANVDGNLSNGALGYFYAASVDTTYTILK